MLKEFSDRIKALKYYGDNEGGELFEAVCYIAYLSQGIGNYDQFTEKLVEFAEYLAKESEDFKEEFSDEFIRGIWG